MSVVLDEPFPVVAAARGLGLVVLDDRTGAEVVAPLVPAHRPPPTQGRLRLRTVDDGPTEVLLRVTDAGGPDPRRAVVLGQRVVTLPAHPAGAPVEVSAAVDADGLALVVVRDLTSGGALAELELDPDQQVGRATLRRMRRALAGLEER